MVNLAEPYNGAGRPAWTPDGESVIFTSSRKLYSVPARGGKAEVWLEPEEEFGAYAAAFLSADEGSQKLLYVEGRSSTEPQSVALDRSSGQRETLAVGRNPVYASSGHVIYDSAAAGIWAIPFSVDTMRATGDPFPISENGTEPSIALDGTLVYLEGAVASGLTGLVWRDREGKRLGEIGEPHAIQIGAPALSPDGSRVAVQARNYDLWIHEVNRPMKTLLLGSPAREIRPIWSPRETESSSLRPRVPGCLGACISWTLTARKTRYQSSNRRNSMITSPTGQRMETLS